MYNSLYYDVEGYTQEKNFALYEPLNQSRNALGLLSYNSLSTSLIGSHYNTSRIIRSTYTTNPQTLNFSTKISSDASIACVVGGLVSGWLGGQGNQQVVRLPVAAGGLSSYTIRLGVSFAVGTVYLFYTIGGVERVSYVDVSGGPYITSSSINRNDGVVTVQFSTAIDSGTFLYLSYTVDSFLRLSYIETLDYGSDNILVYDCRTRAGNIRPNSVRITAQLIDGNYMCLSDDGSGNLVSDVGYVQEGTINYDTGDIHIMFDGGYSPRLGTPLNVHYALKGVLRSTINQNTGAITLNFKETPDSGTYITAIARAVQDTAPVFSESYECLTVSSGQSYLGVRTAKSWIDDGSEAYYDDTCVIRYNGKEKIIFRFLARRYFSGTIYAYIRAYTGNSTHTRVNIPQHCFEDMGNAQLIQDPENTSYNCVRFTIDSSSWRNFACALVVPGARCLELSFVGDTVGYFNQFLQIAEPIVTTEEVLNIYNPHIAAYSLYRPAEEPEGGKNILVYDGSVPKWQRVFGGASVVTAINGSSAAYQTMDVGTSGTAPNWQTNVSSGQHTLHVPLASASNVQAGTINKTDYDRFYAIYNNGGVQDAIRSTGTQPNWQVEQNSNDYTVRYLSLPMATVSGVTRGLINNAWYVYKNAETSIVNYTASVGGTSFQWQYNSSSRIMNINYPAATVSGTTNGLAPGALYNKIWRNFTFSVSYSSPISFSASGTSVTLRVPIASYSETGWCDTTIYNRIYPYGQPKYTINNTYAYNTSTEYTDSFANFTNSGRQLTVVWYLAKFSQFWLRDNTKYGFLTYVNFLDSYKISPGVSCEKFLIGLNAFILDLDIGLNSASNGVYPVCEALIDTADFYHYICPVEL